MFLLYYLVAKSVHNLLNIQQILQRLAPTILDKTIDLMFKSVLKYGLSTIAAVSAIQIARCVWQSSTRFETKYYPPYPGWQGDKFSGFFPFRGKFQELLVGATHFHEKSVLKETIVKKYGFSSSFKECKSDKFSEKMKLHDACLDMSVTGPHWFSWQLFRKEAGEIDTEKMQKDGQFYYNELKMLMNSIQSFREYGPDWIHLHLLETFNNYKCIGIKNDHGYSLRTFNLYGFNDRVYTVDSQNRTMAIGYVATNGQNIYTALYKY